MRPHCAILIIRRNMFKSQTLDTGSSDCHKLAFAVLKMHYEKQKPVIVKYRDYKNFSNV